MSTTIKIKTWACPTCKYSQDFDPTDKDLMALHFPGVVTGKCPACAMGKNETKIKAQIAMKPETDPEKQVTVTIADVAEINANEKLTTQQKTAMIAKRDADLTKFKAIEEK